MEKQVITIPIETDIDPSTLLDIAIALAEQLVNDIETYDSEAYVDEGEVSVDPPE
jgi:hypothetical protein